MGEDKGKAKEARNERQAQIEELLKARGAGQYLPPHKLRMLQEAVTDKESEEYQRLTWDALKKSINGLINKVSRDLRPTRICRPLPAAACCALFDPPLGVPAAGEHFEHEQYRARALC